MIQREAETSPVQRTSTLLHDLIRELVDQPELVRVDTLEGGQAVIYEVTVDPLDVRRVIGRRGRTATAIRELMLNLGRKSGRRYVFEVIEPQGLGVKPAIAAERPTATPTPEIAVRPTAARTSAHTEE